MSHNLRNNSFKTIDSAREYLRGKGYRRTRIADCWVRGGQRAYVHTLRNEIGAFIAYWTHPSLPPKNEAESLATMRERLGGRAWM